MDRFCCDFRAKRRAFTLIEMLVVIAIIAILAAMAAYAVFAMVGSQQSRNTQSTMKVLKDILNKHWQYVIDEADKEAPSPLVMQLANGDIGRAKVIWRKVRLTEAFPQTYTEITTPWVYLTPTPVNPFIPQGQQRYIADYQVKLASLVPANNNPLTQSSACLRIALSARRTGTVFSDDLIKFAIKDTDNNTGDGVSEIVDGWGNPLAFFRFAWNNATLLNTAPAGGKKVYADPTDPDGTLVNSTWFYSAVRPGFEQAFHPVGVKTPLAAGLPPVYPVAPGTPIETPTKPGYRGCYVAPVIVSAGKDGASVGGNPMNLAAAFGITTTAGPGGPQFSSQYPATLNQPDMSIANQAQANDNIYSFQLTGN